MKKILIAVMCMGFAGTTAQVVATDRAGEIKLQQAIDLIESKGDVAKATPLLEEVAGGSDRALAARALLYIAQTQIAKDPAKARATLQRIIQQFPDQKEVVAVARTRALLLGPARRQAEDVVARRLFAGEFYRVTDISRDGRIAVGVAAEPGQPLFAGSSLTLWDVASGKSRSLAATTTRFYMTAVLSADARHIAYTWAESPQAGTSLRVIGVEPDSAPRRLVSQPLIPVGWSVDGSSILCLAGGSSISSFSSMVWVSVSDGSVRTIRTFEPSMEPRVRTFGSPLSPDGAFIVYSALARAGSTERHLFVMDVNGQNDAAVVRLAARNVRPLWSPDGGTLLFSSDAAGKEALWRVPVRNGKAAGEPELIRPDTIETPIGVSSGGELVYTRHVGDRTFVFVAERHGSGVPTASSFIGQGVSWSPDGKSFAFMRERAGERYLVLRSAETGEERSFDPPKGGLGPVQVRWLPDNSGVMVSVREGDSSAQAGSLHIVDVQTGTRTLLLARTTGEHIRSGIIELSPDGKTIYTLARKAESAPWTSLVAVERATGVERTVLVFPGAGLPGGVPGLALSPDGSTFAIQVQDGPGKPARLMTVRTDGSEYRQLFGPFAAEASASLIKWTPDSESVLFVTTNPTGWQIMRISRNGGTPQPDGVSFAKPTDPSRLASTPSRPGSLDLSPDGSRVVFAASVYVMGELWALPNVLSSPPVAR